ncbi:hypothetical protein B0H66DRAFT_822 [Apodospora peruviana]|uniref:FAD-binding PCMH-type domain-containing protein n=1 Tax=Apodospora peruviana TaxID=516989 RepID=A0AAE0MDZ6_9PEZI|nr:hypothetical protein B0H66DRAFT_822 [Apodospora peruviana]
MSIFPSLFFILLGLFSPVDCYNFPYESVQLQDADVANFSAIAFGDLTKPTNLTSNRTTCREFPGSAKWPTENEWSRFNVSLGGALVKPLPPGAVCYPGPNYDSAKCDFLLNNASSTRFYVDDPVTIMTKWPQGETCYPETNPANGTCTQGGFPAYVVNASSVAQIQAAVNFARNKSLRLVIKNTGHDFDGRSAGAGSLSVWTHFFKGFEFLPQYSQGNYTGLAARVGAGLETWELYQFMDDFNITIVTPGAGTVGGVGGWMAGGGHGVISSSYGLGADQPLELQVVTADGRFVTASPTSHPDLFFAMRGGGGSTYGIVTSAIIKVYPRIRVTNTMLSFQTLDAPPPNIFFIPGQRPEPLAIIKNLTTFWHGVDIYFAFTKEVAAAGGAAYSLIIPFSDPKTNQSGFNFFMTVRMPNMVEDQVIHFFQPLFDSLVGIGIAPLQNPAPTSPINWGPARSGNGARPGNSRFATRLLPAKNWDNATLFLETTKAIRATAENGYTFHGVSITPTEKVAGYPGNNAVNPAWRATLMHADVFDYNDYGVDVEQIKDAHERLDGVMNGLRAVSPGAGAYLNEADLQEPGWQQSFFGSNYEKLLKIKKANDPWGVFWAPTTVGSEGWEVRSVDGWPSQNGRLCRVG